MLRLRQERHLEGETNKLHSTLMVSHRELPRATHLSQAGRAPLATATLREAAMSSLTLGYVNCVLRNYKKVQNSSFKLQNYHSSCNFCAKLK